MNEPRPGDRLKNTFCPHLGVHDDPGTCLAFPSMWNYCYHARPAERVSLEHQVSHCLTQQHPRCPVCTRERQEPLPVDLRYQEHAPVRRNKYLWLVIFLLVLTGLFLGWQSIPEALNAPIVRQFLQDQGLGDAQPLIQPSAMPVEATATIQIPATPETAPVESEQAITGASTTVSHLSCGYRLDEPIFSHDIPLVIHQFQSVENIQLLAKRYETTSSAIEALNVAKLFPRWADVYLVIPVKTSDVEHLPAYVPVFVNEEGMSINEMAQKHSVDPDELRAANNLDDTCHFLSGWLLVPQEKPAP